jgi:hypothetical protein
MMYSHASIFNKQKTHRAYHLSGSARKRPRGATAGAGSDSEAEGESEKAKRLRGGRQSAGGGGGGGKEAAQPPPVPPSPEAGGKKSAMPSAEAEQAVLQVRLLFSIVSVCSVTAERPDHS